MRTCSPFFRTIGAVAGKPLPLSVYPSGPSLRIITSSFGIAGSPGPSTINAPRRPAGICVAPFMCEWYMCEPVFGTVNSYVYVWPGSIKGWVRPGTPSTEFGTCRPWKCIAVDSLSLFVRTNRTRSPRFTRTSGPGICLL